VTELVCPSCGSVATGATPLCPTCIIPFVERLEPTLAEGGSGAAAARETDAPEGAAADAYPDAPIPVDAVLDVVDPSAPASPAAAGDQGPAWLRFPWGDVEVRRGEPLVVGREGSTLARRLADYPNVSRRHAEIALADGRLTVEDLNSVNGTFVNGERVPALAPRPLSDGDELRFAAVLRATVRSAGHRGGPLSTARA
jgi:hypothetical protein